MIRQEATTARGSEGSMGPACGGGEDELLVPPRILNRSRDKHSGGKLLLAQPSQFAFDRTPTLRPFI